MNTFNDDRRDETDPLSVLLNDLPQVDPPQTLVGSVMTAIQQHSHTPAIRPAATIRRFTLAKKVLGTMAAAAALALVIMGLWGFPPVDKGTEATIGAAERYQSQQITSADVKTGDAQLQVFLQSDLFHTLATDKAAQAALKNKDFQKALADSSVRAALARPDVQNAIAAMSLDARLEAAKAQISAVAARLDAGPRAALEAALQASPSLAQALAAPGVAEAIGHSSLAAALARPDVAQALSLDASVNALAAAAPGASLDASQAATGAAGSAREGASVEQ